MPIGAELTELEREKAGVEAALARPFAHSETIKQLRTRASELDGELATLVGTDQREQVDEAAQVGAPPPTIGELLDQSFPDLPITPVTGRTGAASVAIGPSRWCATATAASSAERRSGGTPPQWRAELFACWHLVGRVLHG